MDKPPNERYFLDTNIFIYSFDHNSLSKLQTATKLIRDAITTRNGIVSYQVVQEFFHVALRKFAQPMSGVEAEQYFQTVFAPLLAIHSSPALYLVALNLQSSHHLQWYDSLMVASALQGQCRVLFSEDLQHQRKFGNVQVINPFL